MKQTPKHRQIYVIGNWKTNPSSLKELEKLQLAYSELQPSKFVRVIACPSPVHQLLEFPRHIFAGAQDVSVIQNQTGEWNCDMLKGLGVEYCIVGHSERRAIGETDIEIKAKVMALLENNISPILCIGEQHRDEQGKYIHILKHQIRTVFDGLSMAQAGRILIAYEPIWAIGSIASRACTPAECYEASYIISEEVATLVKGISAEDVCVLYGGSVNAMNASSYVEFGNVSGLLIGRASIEPRAIKTIVSELSQYEIN